MHARERERERKRENERERERERERALVCVHPVNSEYAVVFKTSFYQFYSLKPVEENTTYTSQIQQSKWYSSTLGSY